MEVCSQTMFKCDGLPLPNRIVVVGTGVRKILSPILSYLPPPGGSQRPEKSCLHRLLT